MITCNFENGNGASLRHVVVSVLVMRGNEILLARRAKRLLEGGKWGLPGGFMDRDETIIQAAEREVREETGWSIRHTEFFRIIDAPDRKNEDRQNVAFIFIAQAGEQIGEADDETDEIQWFPLDQLPADSDIAFDFAETLSLYRRHLKTPFPLPVFGAIVSRA